MPLMTMPKGKNPLLLKLHIPMAVTPGENTAGIRARAEAFEMEGGK